MSILRVRDDLNTYTYSITKIILFLFIVFLCVFRNRLFEFDNELVNFTITILSFVLVVLSIYCIYISAAELLYTNENRKREKVNYVNTTNIKTKDFKMQDVITMIEINDIIDIEIIAINQYLRIGASSDCRNSDSNFFNKLYYIDENQYEALSEFESALNTYCIEGKIYVISIDGVKV